ncbi:hypothetical protein CEQ51_22715 [Pseudomonas thivervalensis]|uniref:Uncharacterized protein n=1 Tax=Pseudomonas thivervalensis TaxID=86265 RepID=A0A2Z4ZFS0_9PSED|nr:hypothetical protein CE140_22165 [Pseudomonas thivervalensis]AXA62769.1 hypothetical protein CEQ51_22715 [Pseudomonas thivervalensis]
MDAGLAALGHGWPFAAAHGAMPSFRHAEPRRGTKWWGKSVLLTFALFKSEPPSGRNPKQPLPQQRIYTQNELPPVATKINIELRNSPPVHTTDL